MNGRRHEAAIVDSRAAIREIKPFLPLLTVWGVEWILSAGLDVAEEWFLLDGAKAALVWLGIALSLMIAIRAGMQRRSKRRGQEEPTVQWIWQALPGLMVVGSAWLLEAVGAVGPMFVPLFRAVALAICYVQLGAWLGKALVWLGLWLFSLTAVVAVGYLGYSMVVLEGLGGASLLVCGRILQIWGQTDTEKPVSIETKER